MAGGRAGGRAGGCALRMRGGAGGGCCLSCGRSWLVGGVRRLPVQGQGGERRWPAGIAAAGALWSRVGALGGILCCAHVALCRGMQELVEEAERLAKEALEAEDMWVAGAAAMLLQLLLSCRRWGVRLACLDMGHAASLWMDGRWRAFKQGRCRHGWCRGAS